MCDTLCAVRGDGVLFAKSSDRPPREPQVIEALPRRGPGGELRTDHLLIADPGAFAVLGSRPAPLWGLEHGINEHRVAVGNEQVWTRWNPNDAPPALVGTDLVRLALEQARSAAEAVDVIGALLAEHGQGGACAPDPPKAYFSSFLVADPREAWVVETSGRTWAAERRAGGVAISNRITLRDGWTRGSPDLAPGTDFDVFRKPDSPTAHADRRLALTVPVATRRDVTPADLVMLLRDHGGHATPPAAGLPHGQSVTLCMHLPDQTTNAAMVAVLPLDPRAAAQAWVALGSPCTSVFVPVRPPRADPSDVTASDPSDAVASRTGCVPDALNRVETWRRFASLRERARDAEALARVRAVLDPVEASLWRAGPEHDPWPELDAALVELGA